MVENLQTEESREMLRKHFAGLAELDKGDFFSRLCVRRIGQGDRLFAAGEKADSIYFIVQGRFAVHKPVGIGNRSQAVALLAAGTLAGEAGLLAGRRRGADMVAVEDSVVLELPWDAVRQMRQESSQLYIALLEQTLGIVSQRLKKSSERLALIL